MNQVVDFFSGIFDTSYWPARWHCGKWTDFHGWLYILSDLLIWASYFAIPLLILKFILKRNDVPFHKLFWLFSAFILLCGLTHLIDAVIFWWPAYRLSALLRLATGIVSAATVFALYKILPLAFTLKSPKELEKEIEERKKADMEVKKLNIELTRRLSQLQDFAYIASHNLRSPVCNMSNLLALYKEEDRPEFKEGIMSDLDEISRRMTGLLDDLSEVVKLTENKFPEREMLSFSAVFDDVKENLKTEIAENKAEIYEDFTRGSDIRYSSAYLKSVLFNLLSNSLKYRSPDRNPVIHISTEVVGDQVQLVFSDNGSGIDLQQHGHKIFGLYKTFHYHPEAKGVGLFTNKSQIESFGGKIEVQSEPSKGTTFLVDFGPQTSVSELV